MLAPPLNQLLAEAARALAQVRAGRSLTDALDACPGGLRPGVQALSFAALRAQGRCDGLMRRLMHRKPPAWVDALLRVALTQLLPDAQAYASHTLVNQAVQAAKREAPAQANLVNAVLRRFLREGSTLLADVLTEPLARHEHPDWWVARLKQDWPAHWEALLTAAQTAPPMSLRVNARQGDARGYQTRLAADGLVSRQLGDRTPQGVVLESPCPVTRLPGFSDGAVSVQDGAAQRAAPLLVNGAGCLPPLAPGARVLDACAAPGGKTAHLLELGDWDLLALDADATRLRRVDDTLARLGLSAATQAVDARHVDQWWDGRPFDAILLDAPCSGSGINRRHPDVRWLRRPSDLPALQATQAALLDALWPRLKPGGRLLYATCSLFRGEGADQIAAFLQRHADARLQEVPGQTGHLLGLPDNAEAVPTDGFFYALLIRSES
ncbi:16S rRNA (cytosine(967)-C(5))-methyltransferase RsmB [Inhella gelatinilytica]|uniref:16S rRNA (cytosine(967)-C(5))-methyltransferase n=1 Tax=Inhella gelatinilytica TaxID=2795030 RepID=A0A931NE12_9BURK|nr:16S rRNA (cytosine(967)-C(5))-methyltransferase RsmB [Inhella gelatinilytica]MBH9553682.1 16S rRNA (cytosine(967)-C(5))-methyltransferase RsmB [Inhella gelatinilytica]